MTSAEKRTIVEAAIARAYTAIAETSGSEMKDERFGDLLFNINTLEHLEIKHGGTEADCNEPKDDGWEPNQRQSHSDAGTTKEPLAVDAVDATEPEQTTAEDKGETEEPTTYTKEEVKSALAKARVKGVNAVAVLRQVGADSFQTLTSNKYAEVMRIIEQELADAS